MIEIKRIITGLYEENCYIVFDTESRDGVIIDPGLCSDEILKVIESLNIKYILLTHAHFDHIGGVAELKNITGAEIVLNENDLEILSENIIKSKAYSDFYYKQFGRNQIVKKYNVMSFKPDVLICDQDKFEFGIYTLNAVRTPGHTKGGVIYKEDDEGIIFSGDTLFKGTVGRTDFEEGSYSELIKSLKYFSNFPDNFIIYSGHGECTTVIEEKINNPYLNL
ncbi:MAG: MBL fold metallo-hydrolase [Candidatus Fimenecus sp.]